MPWNHKKDKTTVYFRSNAAQCPESEYWKCYAEPVTSTHNDKKKLTVTGCSMIEEVSLNVR